VGDPESSFAKKTAIKWQFDGGMATQGPAGAAQWRMNTPEYNFAPGIVDRSSPATFQRNAYWCRDHAFSQTKQRLALPDAGMPLCFSPAT
jgi:hypothetical protein